VLPRCRPAGGLDEHHPEACGTGFGGNIRSPIQQRQIAYRAGDPDSNRINQLWLVTYLDETGLEVVAQAKLTTGDYAPLIAADLARLESMVPAARDLAKANNIKMRLIKFTNRVTFKTSRLRPTTAPDSPLPPRGGGAGALTTHPTPDLAEPY
jgi:hypothetical protein